MFPVKANKYAKVMGVSESELMERLQDLSSRRARFARGPAEALDLLVDLRWTTDRLASARNDPDVRGVFGDEEDWKDWYGILNNLPVFYWRHELVALVDEAAKTYPLKDEEICRASDVKLAVAEGRKLDPPSYIPRIAKGLCVFDRPLLGASFSNQIKPFSGLIWAVGYSVRRKEFWTCIRGISWRSDMRGAWPVWHSDGGTETDESKSDFGPDITESDFQAFHDEKLRLTRWICTASMFLEQEIISANKAEICPKTVQYASKTLRYEPSCHVVTLRHARDAGADVGSDSQSDNVDWACRWVVRGHWRKQWFPKRQTHAPMWIHPYVKGPEDKPFKPEKPTVFAVTR